MEKGYPTILKRPTDVWTITQHTIHGNKMNKERIRQQIALIERELHILRSMLALDTTETTNVNSPFSTENVQEPDPFAAMFDGNETTETHIELPDTPEGLLSRFFQIAQQNNTSELSTVLHSSISKHPPSTEQFIRFNYRTFLERWTEYLADPKDSSSFTITRQQRNDRGELSELRLYIHSSVRSPCPITLLQDPMQDMHWRIVSSSL